MRWVVSACYLVITRSILRGIVLNNIQSYQHLWLGLASNQRYDTLISQSDKDYFITRVTDEGLSFLTQVLPNIGRSLDRFHSTKEWMSPTGFETSETLITQSVYARIKIYGLVNVPVFMGEAIQQALVGNPTAVDCVRQLSYLFYKLEVPYDKEVVCRFLANFVKIDQEVGELSFDDDKSFKTLVIKLMRGIIHRVLCNEDPMDISPSHGSGVTACRTPNYDKYHSLRYYTKLDETFPYSDYFFFSPTHLADELGKLESAPHMDPQARICLVPKDSRGPRIISCEPAELLYIQQGLMRKLYDILETHELTRGQINFTDQTINQFLSQYGSRTNSLATIDLADASDRVSLKLIEAVFPPRWVEALKACRSETTLLPTGEIVKLNKFAPMGSSCCFPIEALVFWACAQAALRLHYGIGTYNVYVYGDDIILSSHFAGDIMHALETIGLKVNYDKCYADGPFRESCGGDFYLGVDVTPVRLRKAFDTSLLSFETTADFINNLLVKFGYESIHKIVRVIEHKIGYIYPRTLLVLPGTLRTTLSASNDTLFLRRWNKSLQRLEHRVLRPACKVKQRHAPGWCELLRKELVKGLLKSDSDNYVHRLTIADASLLPGQYTDPHSVVSKWEWLWLG